MLRLVHTELIECLLKVYINRNNDDIEISDRHHFYRQHHSQLQINNVSIIFSCAAPNNSPQQLSATMMTSSTITLSWSPPPFEDTNGIIQYYLISITEVDTNITFSPLQSLSTEFTVTNLHPHYTYLCRVAAYTSDIGPYSSPITIQLSEEGTADINIKLYIN